MNTNMADTIVRKDGQIIFRSWSSISLLGTFFITFGLLTIGALISSLNQMNDSVIRSISGLEISCNKKTESKLVDCQISTIPLLGISPPTTETYTGIKRVEYLKETETREDSDGDKYTVTLHYVIFYQTSEAKKIRFDERGSWVASQINQFVNSSQVTLKQVKNVDLTEIATNIGLTVVNLLWVSTIFSLFCFVGSRISLFFSPLVDINGNLRQVVITNYMIPLYRKTFSFSDIKGLVLKQELYGDDIKNYTLEIHTIKNEKIYLWSTYDENEANNLADEIRRISGFYLIEQRLPPTQNS